MAKSKFDVKIVSYGIYDGWDSKSKTLPKIVHFCEEIPARIDVEFGMIINIKKAKGRIINWCIDHPGILDESGNKREPFEGQMKVKNADWKFFLGDTIWDPIHDKMGDWHLWVKLEKEIIAQKTFNIVQEGLSHIW